MRSLIRVKIPTMVEQIDDPNVRQVVAYQEQRITQLEDTVRQLAHILSQVDRAADNDVDVRVAGTIWGS